MKTRIAIAAIVMMMAIQIGAAREPAKRFPTLEKKIEYAKKNWIAALQTENEGVIESVMRIVSKFKLQHPAVDVKELKEAFDIISLTNPSGAVRYKAYIASSICTDPEWYAQEQRVLTAVEENFFRVASTRLHQKLISGYSF
ncbi:MAG: hypothetical protein PHP42_13210 [Bacteroidota bacterium]|nr:hypothetical protein [Bacteroidota bacterium]